MSETNKAIVRRYAEEVISRGNLAVIDELCAADYTSNPPGFPPTDREGDKQLVQMFRTAFPDLRKTIEDLVAEGDKVVERARYQGTHQGEFQGIPPTGKKVNITGMHVFNIKDGKIVETWGVVDQLGMLQQLGVVPTPETT